MIRHELTQDQHILLINTGVKFCQDLAKITASAIIKFPEELNEYVKIFLQDHTSLFSPYTADLIDAELKKLRTK